MIILIYRDSEFKGFAFVVDEVFDCLTRQSDVGSIGKSLNTVCIVPIVGVSIGPARNIREGAYKPI